MPGDYSLPLKGTLRPGQYRHLVDGSANLGRSTAKRRRIASDWLIDFYAAHPKKLKKMLMRLVNEAEDGKNIRYLELVINLLEGPVKDPGTGDTYNFNFLSDTERIRAQESVARIKAMRDAAITVSAELAAPVEKEREEEKDARD